MHTDEYEISLSRELAVCKSTITRIKKFLSIMERKHHMTTEAFLEGLRSGRITEPATDFAAWQDNSESLLRWEELERQYEEMFRMMKI
jgi:hypothetical protein